eukprot:ctg_278.g107
MGGVHTAGVCRVHRHPVHRPPPATAVRVALGAGVRRTQRCLRSGVGRLLLVQRAGVVGARHNGGATARSAPPVEQRLRLAVVAPAVPVDRRSVVRAVAAVLGAGGGIHAAHPYPHAAA